MFQKKERVTIGKTRGRPKSNATWPLSTIYFATDDFWRQISIPWSFIAQPMQSWTQITSGVIAMLSINWAVFRSELTANSFQLKHNREWNSWKRTFAFTSGRGWNFKTHLLRFIINCSRCVEMAVLHTQWSQGGSVTSRLDRGTAWRTKRDQVNLGAQK